MSTYYQNAQTGVITADTSDVLGEVQLEFTGLFGSDLSLDASTPQGTLMQAETVARTAVMKYVAQSSNLLNPDLAYGVYLDAICALMGIERGVNAYTQVDQVSFKGISGTVIAAQTECKSSKGDVFWLIETITLDQNGMGVGSIRALNAGAVVISKEDRLSLINPIAGLQSLAMTINSVITLGNDQESDQKLRIRRKLSLFGQGLGTPGKVIHNVLAVQGVRSVKVIENTTGQAQAIDEVNFTVPYGLWVCVAGEYDDQEIAQALFDAYVGRPYDFGKDNGVPCQEGGYGIKEPYSGQSYIVKWVKPVTYSTYIKMTLKQGSAVYSIEAVKQAIVNWAQGNVASDEGLTLGRFVSGFDISGAVAAQLSGLQIKNCEVYLTTDHDPKQIGDYVPIWVLKPWEIAVTEPGIIDVTLEDKG